MFLIPKIRERIEREKVEKIGGFCGGRGKLQFCSKTIKVKRTGEKESW